MPYRQLFRSPGSTVLYLGRSRAFDVLIGDIVVDVEPRCHYAQEVGFFVQFGLIGGKTFQIIIP